MQQTQRKYMNYTPSKAEFLTSKGIEFFVTDADIIVFEIQSYEHNDTEFFQLAVDYSIWNRSDEQQREQITIANKLYNQFLNHKK